MSRTILYIGSSEDAALRSIRWIKRAVENNRLWSGTFGLTPGVKWAENEIEINHKLFDRPIWVLGVGITSTNIRGINFDDYRPDLIVGDDILQDENSSTLDQRDKISNLILSAVKNSLISRVEEPNAKMVLLNTPQHREDFSQQAKKDPEFATLEISCWTKATRDKPTLEQESSWPELYPTPDLRAEKLAAIKRNKLSTFLREKEVRLTTVESVAFRPEWLKIVTSKPVAPFCVLGIDPLPPPSDKQRATGSQQQDWEAQYVWGREAGEYFLMESARSRGHDPNWTINTAFTLAHKYRVARILVESVAYQRTLKWMLEQEMRRRRVYYVVIPYVDKRKKFTRIVSTLSGVGAQGLLNVGVEDSIFIDQFTNYAETTDDPDDDLDASAIALSDLIVPALERTGSLRDDDVEEISFRRLCP
jgi:phage terminase large subunit-like protein